MNNIICSEAAAETSKVIEKVFNILKRELSAEEYLIYLQAIAPKNQRYNRTAQGHY